MASFMNSKFPPGLLNPGNSAAADGAAHWCVRFLGVECPNRREFIFNVFFSSRGVRMLLPLSVVLLLLYRLVGPPEVDEREAQLRQQWADHKKRFKSGAKRSSLRGVIRSSYLTELGGRSDGKAPSPSPAAAAASAAAVAARKPLAWEGGGASPPRRSDNGDDGWEDVRPTDATPAALADSDNARAKVDPRLPPPREVVYVSTTPGPTRVTIVGDRGAGGGAGGAGGAGRSPGGRRVSVVTLHAVGHNHRTCLGALEREVAKDGDLGGGGGVAGGGMVFYHVDTPGHEEEGQEIEAKAFSLEAQAAQLLQVTIHLGLTWFVGLGVGAGANVLLRFACDNPDMMAGLILANGSAEDAGRRERNAWLSPRFRLSWEKNMKAARESLIPLSFPSHSSLGSRYRAALGTMHAGNVLKYVDASLCRDDITASRLEALNDVWVLLLSGTEVNSSGGVGEFLTGMVAGVDAEGAARSLLDKLRRAAGSAGGGGASKATLVTLGGGGHGGGLLEAKPLEALAAIKLFLNKCSSY